MKKFQKTTEPFSREKWGIKRRAVLRVNGGNYEVFVKPNRTLLEVLREDFHLTGAKEACGIGAHGACTVLVNGKPVNSCITPRSKSRRTRDRDGRRTRTGRETLSSPIDFPLDPSANVPGVSSHMGIDAAVNVPERFTEYTPLAIPSESLMIEMKEKFGGEDF